MSYSSSFNSSEYYESSTTSLYSSGSFSSSGSSGCFEKNKKAIKKLEHCYLHLKPCDHLDDKEYLIKHLPKYISKVILKRCTTLVEILACKWKRKDKKIRKIFKDSVGKALLNKLLCTCDKDLISSIRKWYRLDKRTAQIIIASSLTKKGDINGKLFDKRFKTRIKSKTNFTKLFY